MVNQSLIVKVRDRSRLASGTTLYDLVNSFLIFYRHHYQLCAEGINSYVLHILLCILILNLC